METSILQKLDVVHVHVSVSGTNNTHIRPECCCSPSCIELKRLKYKTSFLPSLKVNQFLVTFPSRDSDGVNGGIGIVFHLAHDQSDD